MVQVSNELKDKRFGARVPENVYDTIKRAAEIEGKSMTDYVMGIAYDHALDRIERAEVMNLSKESSQAVAEMLLDPSPPAPAMIRAADHHQRLIGDL